MRTPKTTEEVSPQKAEKAFLQAQMPAKRSGSGISGNTNQHHGLIGKAATAYELYRNGGIPAVAVRLQERLRERCRPRVRIREFSKVARRVTAKKGLEIGGPSGIFSRNGCLPLYHIIAGLDGCNFSQKTIWEGEISEGHNYRFGKKCGFQYIAEATDLKALEANSYDFLLASHCLEHTANPLLAISEWLRILKRDGCIVFVLPDSRYTFDHHRPVTSFDHLLADFAGGVKEDDLTHLDEILSLHDLSMDIAAGDATAFRRRLLENFNNRCLHHHVFDLDLLRRICGHFKLRILTEEALMPCDLVVVAEKVPST